MISLGLRAGDKRDCLTIYETIDTYRGGCPCGAGRLVVSKREPEHAWSSSSVTWSARIDCGVCAQRFVLVMQEGAYVLVNKA